MQNGCVHWFPKLSFRTISSAAGAWKKNLDVSLDLEFRKDGGASLLDQLTYTTEDWQKHRPLLLFLKLQGRIRLVQRVGFLKNSG